MLQIMADNLPHRISSRDCFLEVDCKGYVKDRDWREEEQRHKITEMISLQVYDFMSTNKAYE